MSTSRVVWIVSGIVIGILSVCIGLPLVMGFGFKLYDSQVTGDPPVNIPKLSSKPPKADGPKKLEKKDG